MESTRFPIAYWGSISYYQELCKLKFVFIEAHETFPKQTLRNRTSILSANGILDLSIPIMKPHGSKSLSKDILVDDSQNWRKIHWRALVTAYASSPYFEHYASEIEQLLFNKEQNLVQFNLRLIQFISNHLELPVEIKISAAFDKTSDLTYLKYFEQKNTEVNYSYQQVFQLTDHFIQDLSILDALMNLGPLTRKILIN
jgi:hypothetical protein